MFNRKATIRFERQGEPALDIANNELVAIFQCSHDLNALEDVQQLAELLIGCGVEDEAHVYTINNTVVGTEIKPVICIASCPES